MPDVSSRLVEVCPFRIRNDRGEYLLIRRASDDPLYPGLWQFVTGRVEKGEKAHQAALRELREETGAEPLKLWTVPGINSFYDPREDVVSMVVLFAAQIDGHFIVRLSAEHSASDWLPFAEARRRLVWPGQRSCLEIVRDYILGGESAGTLLELPL
jgi:dATP pyrophosphohydrolase